MEYTSASSFVASAGSLKRAASDNQYKMDDALNKTNYVPLFNMNTAQFSTLRTWYG